MAFKLLPDEPKESKFNKESLHRLPAQFAKGAAAAIPGIFGDIASAAHTYIADPISSSITGEESTPYEQSWIGKILPTTEQHKKNLEEGIPYLKPKNKVEKFVSDVAEDTSSLFLPGAALTRAGLRGTNATRSFLTSLGANSAGEIVSDLSGDPKKGAYTKMGSMFVLSALNKPGVQRELGNLYNRADRLLPQNATVDATRLQTEMNGLRNRVLSGRQVGDLAPSETFVINEVDAILRQIQNGQSNVGTLRSAVRSLNENLQRAVYEAPNRATRVRARSLATQINRNVRNTLADYGRQNPEWWRLQQAADQGTAAFHQSNFVTRFIENNLHPGTLTGGLLHALGVSTGATGAIVPYQAAKIIYRISNSPELARHYARTISSAAAENAPVMNKEIKKIDKELQKEKSKKKFKILD